MPWKRVGGAFGVGWWWMQGTQVRIDDRELEGILRDVFGERRHGVVATTAGEGVINDTRRLTWPDGMQRMLRIAPSDAFAEAGPSWFTPYGLRREAAVIAAAGELAAYLPVTVAHDFERRVIDRDWVIQEVMPGVVLRTVDDDLPTEQREGVWIEIGEFSKRLHGVSSGWFGPPAWGPAFDRWSELLAWDVDGLNNDAARFGYDPGPFERLAELVTSNRNLLDEVTRPGLIHSDLNRGHLFVARQDGHWRLRGTIDLEFGRFADPLSESLIVGFEWDNAPLAMEATFLRGYAPDGLTDEDHHRIRIYAALALAWFAPLLAMTGDPLDDLMQRFGTALDRAESGN
jgi:aminoglycoside phosphotransferase (APT) family kinase protein